MDNFNDKSLIEIDRFLFTPAPSITLCGTQLTVKEIVSAARHLTPVNFTTDPILLRKIQTCYDQMIQDVKNGTPIYGCNTGYGARAEKVMNQGSVATRLKIAQQISESIVHTDVTVGPQLTKEVTRAAILIRLNMLINGVSAVRLEDLEIYRQALNADIIPIVNAFGGLGASGDLAHNSRVLSALRQLPGVMVEDHHDKVRSAKSAYSKSGIKKLVLEPKAGLGLVNGDNFSTAAATLITTDIVRYSLIADVLGAMVIEVLRGSNRTFHPFLSQIRPHPGQGELAALYRYLLDGSQLAFQEMTGHILRPPGVNIQDAYSLRCITQSEGFNREQIKWALNTITINANSVSDNPLWVTPEYVVPGEKPWQWVSGGNFFAMHMGEVMDSMRKITTRLIKRNDRHLHRLVSPNSNNGLPANLSDPKAVSSCAFKGIQLQSGMFDVYTTMLSQPVTTLFGIHEENNQDITPHSLTSAIMAWENLKLLRYSLSMNLLAVAQAVDLRGGRELLSPHTRPVYDLVRRYSKYVTVERPLNSDIETLASSINSGELNQLLRDQVLSEFK